MTENREPADVASESNYWTLSIHDLDSVLDLLKQRGDTIAVSKGSACLEYAHKLREAATIIREVRDSMLAANYDANRKGVGVSTGRAL